MSNTESKHVPYPNSKDYPRYRVCNNTRQKAPTPVGCSNTVFSSSLLTLQIISNPVEVFWAHLNCFEVIMSHQSYPEIWRHISSRDFHFPSIYLQLQRFDSKSHISTGRACFSALTPPGWVESRDRWGKKAPTRKENLEENYHLGPL